MNEVIREFAEQAGVWKQQPPHVSNTNNPIDFPVSPNRDLEKYTELIVRECIWRLMVLKQEAIDNDWRADEVMSIAITDISEHFGVDE